MKLKLLNLFFFFFLRFRTLFLITSSKVQQYIYNIYEQASTSNTNPTGLNLLETGIMELKQASTIFTAPTATTERIIP